MKIKINWTIVLCLCSTFIVRAQTNEQVTIKQMEPKSEFTSLLLGEVKSSGWLKKQMQADVKGFVGNLEHLIPDLIDDPIYGSGRLHRNSKLKDLGNNKEGDAEGDEQYKWWNSESQSNWWDGYLRNAFLLDDKHSIARVQAYIDRILQTQDADGYLGIYTPELRYQFVGENGELWAKSTLYRGLLGYYEATGEKRVWDALVRAVDNVMQNYPIHKSHPFDTGKGYNGGVAHGLTFTDVLDRMYELAGDKKYLEYAAFLYMDYSRNFSWEQDAQLANVLSKDYKLKCHAVHTYEHLRSLIVTAGISEDRKVNQALVDFLHKISGVVTPTGGAIGDEWIAERQADATHTGYEYCSLHELMDSYSVLYQKTGLTKYAELAENIFYNAAQGARHPHHSCIAYLKTDNSYEMMGTRNGDNEPDRKQTRYKYSPVHQDVAVCCVPNAGRITPYFLQKAWLLQGEENLVANFLVPCVLDTKLGGKNVRIENVTDYPMKNQFSFRLNLQEPMHLTLKIRKPTWVTGIHCSESYQSEGDYIVISRDFKSKDTFSLSFETEVRTCKDLKGETYFAYGAQFFAYPIKARELQGRVYAKHFNDYMYEPLEDTRFQYIADHQAIFHRGKIQVHLLNMRTGKKEEVDLVPLKETILRQAAF
ncbi:beta-L-arabinofuranosidase domain-containing protein [Bacteroides sp.]|uniref:beta-L-arabinofuranosidase domain-containing protein n=1 Tax=Bacteroides sp. TaxID=29523 RepID=UPI003AB36AB4